MVFMMNSLLFICFPWEVRWKNCPFRNPDGSSLPSTWYPWPHPHLRTSRFHQLPLTMHRNCNASWWSWVHIIHYGYPELCWGAEPKTVIEWSVEKVVNDTDTVDHWGRETQTQTPHEEKKKLSRGQIVMLCRQLDETKKKKGDCDGGASFIDGKWTLNELSSMRLTSTIRLDIRWKKTPEDL